MFKQCQCFLPWLDLAAATSTFDCNCYLLMKRISKINQVNKLLTATFGANTILLEYVVTLMSSIFISTFSQTHTTRTQTQTDKGQTFFALVTVYHSF